VLFISCSQFVLCVLLANNLKDDSAAGAKAAGTAKLSSDEKAGVNEYAMLMGRGPADPLEAALFQEPAKGNCVVC
jgi:hypothetical protein